MGPEKSKLQELLDRVDAEIEYPFERFVEKFWPMGDRVLDVICGAVWTAEIAWDEPNKGAEKKEFVLAALMEGWHNAPFPAFIAVFLKSDPVEYLIRTALSVAIDRVVALLNSLTAKRPLDAVPASERALVRTNPIAVGGR
jgi:hypothetical protein